MYSNVYLKLVRQMCSNYHFCPCAFMQLYHCSNQCFLKCSLYNCLFNDFPRGSIKCVLTIYKALEHRPMISQYVFILLKINSESIAHLPDINPNCILCCYNYSDCYHKNLSTILIAGSTSFTTLIMPQLITSTFQYVMFVTLLAQFPGIAFTSSIPGIVPSTI